MSAAAFLPSVRSMVLCDEVIESETEPGVFTLGGVRQELRGGPPPFTTSLNLFLVLYSARPGIYCGYVDIDNVEMDDEKSWEFKVSFDAKNQVVPLGLALDGCQFPSGGTYTIQVWFKPPDGENVVKKQLPFRVFLQ